MSKAQIITGDFVVSITIFMILLALVLPVWGYVDYQIRSAEDIKNMNSISLLISDALVRSKGSPSDWNETNVRSIGFADRERELNLTKILHLLDIDYNTAKALFGIQMYEIYITLTDTDGVLMNKGGEDLEYGNVMSDPKNVVKIRRVAILDREITVLNIYVWN